MRKDPRQSLHNVEKVVVDAMDVVMGTTMDAADGRGVVDAADVVTRVVVASWTPQAQDNLVSNALFVYNCDMCNYPGVYFSTDIH